jgi:hypothetical protein
MGAPINRYDTPAQASFINTYVPIPFEKLMAIDQMKQAKIEENDKLVDNMTAVLGATRVAKPDEQGYLNWRADKQGKLTEILSSTQPGGYEQKRAIMQLQNSIMQDPYYRTVVQNYEPYTKAMTEYQDKAGEYGADSAAVYQRKKQLDEFDQLGTAGLMKKKGSGLLQPVGIGTNEPVKPEIDKYIDAMQQDAYSSEATDKEGKWIIGAGEKSLGYEKLGGPLGIQFETYKEGGKNMLRIATNKDGGIDYSKISVPMDLFKTKGGQTMLIEAQKEAEQSGGKIDVETAVKKRYVDTAYRSIQEKVSRSSEYTLQANPYGEMYARKALEEQKPVYTMDVLVGEPAVTETSSMKSIQNATDAISNKITSITNNKKEYESKYKVTYDANKDAKDGEGRYIGSVLAEYGAGIEQEKAKQDSLNNALAIARRDAGTNPNWVLGEDLKKKADEYAAGRAEKDKFTALAGSAKDGKGVDSSIYAKGGANYEKYYNEFINDKSDESKAINAKLKENSAARLARVGVTTFPTITDQKTFEDLAFKFTNEGTGASNKLGGGTQVIYDGKTGLPFTDDQYQEMSRTSKEGEKPEVMGFFYNSKRGVPQIMVRFKNKKGEMMDPSYIDAPAGTEGIFIRAGRISIVESMLQKQLGQLSSKFDQQGNLTVQLDGRIGDDSPNASAGSFANVRVLQPSTQKYTPSGDQYEMTYYDFRTDKNEVVNYSSREKLIADYINYQAKREEYLAKNPAKK